MHPPEASSDVHIQVSSTREKPAGKLDFKKLPPNILIFNEGTLSLGAKTVSEKVKWFSVLLCN